MPSERKTTHTLRQLVAMYRGNDVSCYSSATLAEDIGLIALSATYERFEARDFLAHLLEDSDSRVHRTAYMRARYLASHGKGGQKLQAAMRKYEQVPDNRKLVEMLDAVDEYTDELGTRLQPMSLAVH